MGVAFEMSKNILNSDTFVKPTDNIRHIKCANDAYSLLNTQIPHHEENTFYKQHWKKQ